MGGGGSNGRVAVAKDGFWNRYGEPTFAASSVSLSLLEFSTSTFTPTAVELGIITNTKIDTREGGAFVSFERCKSSSLH